MKKISPKLNVKLNNMLDEMFNSRFVSANNLKKKLSKSFRIIRNYYKSILSYNRLDPQDKWIYENYYVIESAYKQAFHQLKHEYFLSSNSQHIPDLVVYLIEVIRYENVLISEDGLEEIIRIFENKRYIHNFEYDFLNTFIKISAIVLISDTIKLCLKERFLAEISRLIGILTTVDAIDFASFNYSNNRLEAVLLKDPTGVYSKQSEKTRSLYRYKVAKSAFYENCDELTLANTLITQANNDKRHIGFYIYQHYDKVKPKNPIANYNIKLYFFLALILSIAASVLAKNIFILPLLYPLMYELVRPFFEKICLRGSEVTYPPRLDLCDTVPEDMQTLVVISTLLPSGNTLNSLSDKLINMLLQNKNGAVGFCLLCDLNSSKEQHETEDKDRINSVKEIIEKLNSEWENKFLLVVRKRSYSKTQDEYTGYERKRGAISDLIELIKGKNIELAGLYGNTSLLPDTKYILTLDFDTCLKINIVSKLVSIAAHPLNKPIIDKQKGIVTSGYGIISPKMTLDLKSSQSTFFSLIFGGIGGTTTYDASCSELYQDLYDRGIFCGKGLIDVEAYESIIPNLFQEETLLSHDIIEGGFLRALYTSDTELIESFPKDGISYFKRLNRWVRGDFQNTNFIANSVTLHQSKTKNPLDKVIRFQLFDNLRRALTPVFAMICILLSTFTHQKTRTVMITFAILGTISPYLHSFINLIISGSVSALTTRFYSSFYPIWIELVYSSIENFLFLPQYAYICVDAAVKGIYRRFFSKKKMLEWSTAFQVENNKNSLFNKILFYLPQIIVGALLLIFGSTALKIIGLLFIIQVAIAFLLLKSPIKKVKVPKQIASYLTVNLSKMLSYYTNFAGSKDNYLPPDNMQKAPVYRVAHRTSPTNIGLMLISYLTARDFMLIDTKKLYDILNETITTVEKLKKYHGNLYNWYDTKTLDTLKPEFVSTVDSGNFLCCLVALKEGLKEYLSEENAIEDLIKRIEVIINSADLSKFYDSKKDLFSIGYDVNNECLYKSHYDLLMSEARMTSYFAISKGQVPVKHWSALSRTMSRTLFHSGPVSWTGTMFEYFMPELLLHCINGSIGREALNYCIGCQIKRADKFKTPFGISESAIYAFDEYLNYQYSPNGVQKVALKRGMDEELVISPYSSYLTLPFELNKSYCNLKRLDRMNATGEFGHYESIDYTKKRVINKYIVIKSYMAHHVGMSIVAINNALNDNIMQKRFLRDKQMQRATELLNERNSVGEIMLESLFKRRDKRQDIVKQDESEYVGELFPQQPRVKILTNTDVSCILTDIGASYIKSNKTDILRRPVDLLRDAKGSFCYIKFKDKIFSTTLAPSYDNEVTYETTFSKSSANYFAKTEDLKVNTEVRLHNTLACEQRKISIENLSSNSDDVTLLYYLEPSLAKEADDYSHPAFSKLFISIEKDEETNTIVATRKKRGSEDIYYVAVGFREDISFDYEANRENLFERCNLSSIKPSAFSDEFISNTGVPDPCIAIRTSFTISKREIKPIYLITSVSTSRVDAVTNILAMREQLPIESETSATSKLAHATLEHRVGQTILPQILFNRRDSSNNLKSIAQNKLNPQSLWQLAISGDVPIVLVNVFSDNDYERVEVYLKCHSLLKLSFIEFDLVFLYNDSPKINDMIRSKLEKYNCINSISAKAGIHIIDKSKLSDEVLNLLYASACHIATKSLIRIEAPTQKYVPVKINNCQKGDVNINANLSILGGEFSDNSFYITQTPKLPWCHVLCNPTFGTLVSDKALGFTWAINSRENKLTPWYNDTMRDNTGEMLNLKLDDEYFDIVNGSVAEFSPEYVKYYSTVGDLSIITTVTVPLKGMIKYISVEIENTSNQKRDIELAYYTEPVMSFSRKNSRQINGEIIDDILLLNNPFNASVSSHMALTCYSDEFQICCDRPSFLCGRWENNAPPPFYDNCATVIVKKEIKPLKTKTISYAMAFSTTKNGVLKLIKLRPNEKYKPENYIQINTNDKSIDALVNTWLPWQIISSRIWGRTGFYQCGGAYGFRDQLQDVCGYMLLSPKIARQHIIRCCASQFEAGDVFHWWHTLPKQGAGKKGVRTKYSDDLVWLPYTVCQYILRTGDYCVLSVETSYLVSDELKANQKDNYVDAKYTGYKESVYSHCIKAIDRAYNLGKHSLVKIGSGDWNDGYSNVGVSGEGESVWLSQFLALTMNLFSDICVKHDDVKLAQKYNQTAKDLLLAVDKYGYDGAYYLRAFFDDGDKMGSNQSEECKIDSLTQSFASIVGMENKERVKTALNSAFCSLVDESNSIIKLFTPPFDSSEQEPGYVKSYPSGVRENGGQYTHAAVWFAIATALENMPDKFFCLTHMLNPIKKYENSNIADRYMIEPYYIAADIYTNKDAYGRGGWSIYTGSASWYYQLLVEHFLGIKLSADSICVAPMLPSNINGYKAKIRYNKRRIDLTLKSNVAKHQTIKLEEKNNIIEI